MIKYEEKHRAATRKMGIVVGKHIPKDVPLKVANLKDT